jgi:peptidyl-prolyl cis-trans isomerase B (cyclophilin B)
LIGLSAGLLVINSSARASAAIQSGEDLESVEAVIETSRGEIVVYFFPKDAPRHVEYFISQARAGVYDGTTFHRIIKNALIQGGDPNTKNTAARAKALYGTGGLNAGLPDEVNRNKNITGAVSCVLAVDRANPDDVKPGSSGSQFFIVLNLGPAKARLDQSFTVFGRVVSGMDVAMGISNAPSDQANMANERIEIKKVTIRPRTPSVEQMKAMSAIIETSLGNLKLEFLTDVAPNTVRQFIQLARSGMYDGTSFYRVSQKYYLEAGNLADWPADSPNRKRFFSLWSIPFEKNELNQVRGTVSMRQIDEGWTRWYFFIINQDNSGLNGKSVPFAKVVEGLDVVDKIAATEVDGDKPKQRIDIRKITVQ